MSIPYQPSLQPNGSYPTSAGGMPMAHPQQQQFQHYQQPFVPMPYMQQQQPLPPPQQQQQHFPPMQQQQQYPMHHYPPPHMQGRVSYPHPMFPSQMVNRGFSHNIQGVFSTYPARLKQSEDNALLLPSSYLTNKKPRFAPESDDDFDDGEDSDEGTPSSGMRTRSAVAAAATAAAGRTSTPGSQGPPQAELRKVLRKKNHIYPPEKELERASKMEEVLVPIRLDIDLDEVKLRDAFLWNMNEQFLSPEKFAELLCEDLELPVVKFVPLIAESIRTQVMDFEAVHEVELPSESIRVVINLDLQIGKINLRDRFEWDLNNTSDNAPEVFSKQLAAEAGLGGEYVPIIAHAIREQLYRHKRRWVDESLHEELAEPLLNGFRNIEDAASWAPQMEVLSNEELEKLLIAQERNMRRLRRETRFKRSRRRLSATPSRRPHGTP
ncbi:hypothetical protein BDB00DRAFT_866398 [Zychaea mexicana]|uniref:uncharacterized protein n=1 Tax=Zychaea mexicana TaxID=64656 RepID=UPI0022FE74DA|nr:uncharacterized protein BDB00DRAFT_866398 [Zychaea mexicana]KAI9499525.1 hypothetical protein BDB00DRAFT_866398 [Zychaea mexicana]